jgi:hypothetical protein
MEFLHSLDPQRTERDEPVFGSIISGEHSLVARQRALVLDRSPVQQYSRIVEQDRLQFF